VRLVLFGNNELALRILQCLKSQAADLVGLVLHPAQRARSDEELTFLAGLPARRILRWSADPAERERLAQTIESWQPRIGLSVKFGYIIPADMISCFPQGILNLHTSLLPYNRGAHPNVWPLVDGTPAGATLHYIDDGLDTGPIVDQKPVEVEFTDTAKSLFDKLDQAALQVFERAWPLICQGSVATRAQPDGGTTHRVRELEALGPLDTNQNYRLLDVINLMRARTFPPWTSST